MPAHRPPAWCADAARRDRLIIVLTDGEIAVSRRTQQIDWERTNALPSLMKQWFDSVPLFVDLRQASREEQQTLLDPDYKKAINLIVATLRNENPIQLSGKEILQHRRNIRIRNAFTIGITGLALLLAFVSWVAWEQKKRADLRAREATSRRLAAEAERLAEARIDTALLLMAQAYRMGDNAALRSSWWRLLTRPNLPDTYLPERASDVRFEPEGSLRVTTSEATSIFVLEQGSWSRASTVTASTSRPSWEWQGGCDQCEDDDIWACAGTVERIIGPYGDSDTFCAKSRLRVPGWCVGQEIEFPGVSVRARRDGRWVRVETESGSASFACDGDPGAPVLVTGSPSFFDARFTLEFLRRSGPEPSVLSRSFDARWLAVVRVDGGVEVWRWNGATDDRRLGVATLDLPAHATAIAASANGALAVAIAPAPNRERGDIFFWRDHRDAVARRDPSLLLRDAWQARPERRGLLTLTHDGSRLLGGTDVVLPIWETTRGSTVAPALEIGRHAAVAAEVSSNGRQLAVVLEPLDGAARWVSIFDLARGGDGERLPSPARDVAFDLSGVLLTAGANGVQSWSLERRAPRRDHARRIISARTRRGCSALGGQFGRAEIGAAKPGRSNRDRALQPPGSSGERSRVSDERRCARQGIGRRARGVGLADRQLDDHRRSSSFRRRIAPRECDLALREEKAVVYDLNPDHWLELTCNLVRRDLTRAEWRTHIGDDFEYGATCPAASHR